jgi:hypothetical protein
VVWPVKLAVQGMVSEPFFRLVVPVPVNVPFAGLNDAAEAEAAKAAVASKATAEAKIFMAFP